MLSLFSGCGVNCKCYCSANEANDGKKYWEESIELTVKGYRCDRKKDIPVTEQYSHKIKNISKLKSIWIICADKFWLCVFVLLCNSSSVDYFIINKKKSIEYDAVSQCAVYNNKHNIYDGCSVFCLTFNIFCLEICSTDLFS